MRTFTGILVSFLLFSAAGPSAHAAVSRWYFDIGLGASFSDYTQNSALQTFSNQQSAISNLAFPMDIELGMYSTLGNRHFLGLVLDDQVNYYFQSSAAGYAMVLHGTFDLSYRYFFGDEALGWFLRTDLGYGAAEIEVLNLSSMSSTVVDSSWAVVGGIGYTLPMSGLSRFVLEADYSYMPLASGRISAVVIKGSAFFWPF